MPKKTLIVGEVLSPIPVSADLLAKPKTSSELALPTPVSTITAQKTRPMKDRLTDLALVSAQCDKDWSTKHSLVRLGNRVNQPLPSITTGLFSLDREVFGCGGVPRGRIIEIIGPESSGKTTIALEFIAEEQKDGGIAAYVDAEHALDVTYASKLGVDVDNLLISQPDYGEHALGVVDALVRSGLVSVIVIDSVSALVPKAELDGDMGDSHMGLQARLMSQAMRKLSGIAEKSGTTLIFINQIREKIGVMFGSPETTSGGRALKFYASVRLDIRRRAAILEGGKDSRELGFNMEIKAIKNKVAVPKKSTILRLYYPGESDIVGFDKIGDLLEFGSARGVIELKGAWYNFNGERIGQGFDNAREALAGNPEWLAKIIKAVKESK